MASSQEHRIRVFGANLRTASNALVLSMGFALALTLSMQAQTFSVIYNVGGASGGFPFAGLTMGKAGDLYGTDFQGGEGGFGGIFRLSPSKTGWTATTLYTFNGGNNGGDDGGYPSASLVCGPAV